MILRGSVALLIAAALVSPLWAQTLQQPLHFAFWRTVASGEFPAEHWSSGPEDQLDGSIQAAKSAMHLVKQLSSDDGTRINDAFENRIGLLRWNEPAPSVDSVLQRHRAITDIVASIRFPAIRRGSERISFGEITSEKLKAFWQLIVLATLDSAAPRDFDRASDVLAGGFAASRWWQRADEYEMILRALVLEERLHRGLVDLQAVGAPILDNALSQLHDGMLPTDQLEQAVWIELCEDFPIFKTNSRDVSVWEADLKSTFSSFKFSSGSIPQILSTIDSRSVGRRLQQEAAKRLHSIDFAGVVESSDAQADGAREPGRGNAAENGVVQIISASLDQVLLKPIELSRKLSMDARQRLVALRCAEIVRSESLKRGQWISSIDKSISSSFPPDPRGGGPFSVQVRLLEPLEFPIYRLPLAPTGPADDAIYLEFGTQAKYGED